MPPSHLINRNTYYGCDMMFDVDFPLSIHSRIYWFVLIVTSSTIDIFFEITKFSKILSKLTLFSKILSKFDKIFENFRKKCQFRKYFRKFCNFEKSAMVNEVNITAITPKKQGKRFAINTSYSAFVRKATRHPC